MTISKPVFIAGPPCSGKSSVGKRLASLLRCVFLDLDELVQDESGMTIPRIFMEKGERYFRELEHSCLRKAVMMDGVFVMALGGGCLLLESNLKLVRENGILVSLTASREELLRRNHGNSERPLASSRQKMIRLLDLRAGHYESLPDPLDTTGLTVREAAEELLNRLAK